LRTLAHIATTLAAVAGILALSVAIALRDQRRLLDDFTATNRDEVAAAAQALAGRLDALDRDTRMLVELVERSMRGGEPELAIQKRLWENAFESLAKVVAPYQSISLHRPDGTMEVVGLDPRQQGQVAISLLEQSRAVALEVSKTGTVTLHRPALHREQRAYFFFAAPVRGYGTIVVASDVASFLDPLAASHPDPVASRLFVTDPAGEVWTHCGSPDGCRAVPPSEVPAVIRHATVGATQLGARAAETVGLGHAPAVRITQPVGRPTGSWTVTAVASSEAIITREQALLLRLVATAVAAALAVAAVGVVILRQQRNALALEGRLHYAQALASARETSESIVENAPLGVLGISQDGRVALANRFLADRLGPIRVGAPLRTAFSGEGAAWIRELEPVLLGKTAPADSAYRDVHRPSTGSPPFEVRIVPVRNPALGVQTFALFEDRTTIRNLENQLVRAEKLITVGVLSAGIAHEIGSPLAVIRGRAEQVLRHVDTGPRADDLRVIIKHIDHISSTIRQLLDFSRRQPIERRAVPLDSVVKRARELLQWKLEPRHLQLQAELDADLPALAADPDQLQQVLVNLLLNACDASPPGGVIRLCARRSTAAGPPAVTMEVIDLGCGIALEHLHAVFDPFFTTKKGGEGTGLGLPIVASIVRNHAGEINLSSTPGKGTTVTVSWPALGSEHA
jgi:signal transduction histidine kinase